MATAIAMRPEEDGRVKPGHDDWLEMRDEMCACESGFRRNDGGCSCAG